MFRRNLLIGASVLAAVSSASVLAWDRDAQKDEQERVELRTHADETLQKLFKEVGGSKQLYDKASGYAVIRVAKGGFIVSGSGGAGVAVDKATKHTTYMKMGAASVGLTVGGAKFDMVFLFQTKDRFNEFVSGGWDSAAGAKATAGKDSASAASDFFDGQIVYTLSDKGLMASADVSGTKYWADDDLNKK